MLSLKQATMAEYEKTVQKAQDAWESVGRCKLSYQVLSLLQLTQIM